MSGSGVSVTLEERNPELFGSNIGRVTG